MLVPIPVNPTTVNRLTHASIKTTEEMAMWLKTNQISYGRLPRNSEETAKSRVGEVLYEKIFRPYTLKQWEREPKELAPEVLARIPVHSSFDTRYFTDKYQVLPERGYTSFIENILDHHNIAVALNVDFFKVQEFVQQRETIFTGPIDAFFRNSGLPKLQYRSLRFEHVIRRNTPFFQPNSVVNYPELSVPFTRIVEHKHFLEQESNHTVYSFEYPSSTGEPYYPVPNSANQELYRHYQKLSEMTKDVHFVGRLASYKYFNMDAAIDNALSYFHDHFESKAVKNVRIAKNVLSTPHEENVESAAVVGSSVIIFTHEYSGWEEVETFFVRAGRSRMMHFFATNGTNFFSSKENECLNDCVVVVTFVQELPSCSHFIPVKVPKDATIIVFFRKSLIGSFLLRELDKQYVNMDFFPGQVNSLFDFASVPLAIRFYHETGKFLKYALPKSKHKVEFESLQLNPYENLDLISNVLFGESLNIFSAENGYRFPDFADVDSWKYRWWDDAALILAMAPDTFCGNISENGIAPDACCGKFTKCTQKSSSLSMKDLTLFGKGLGGGIKFFGKNRWCAKKNGWFADSHSFEIGEKRAKDCGDGNSFGGCRTIEDREAFYSGTFSSKTGTPCGYFLPSGFDQVREQFARRTDCSIVVFSIIVDCYDIPFYQPPQHNNSGVCYILLLDKKTESALKRANLALGWESIVMKSFPVANPSKNAEFLKTTGHRLFPRSKWIIWIDGKCSLELSPQEMVKHFQKPFVGIHHPARDDTLDEFEPTIARIRSQYDGAGHTRLILQQRAQYEVEGYFQTRHTGLLDIMFIAYRNHVPCTSRFLCAWVNEILMFSHRGQLSESYARDRTLDGPYHQVFPSNYTHLKRRRHTAVPRCHKN